MTAADEVRFSRVYFECSKCLGGGCPLAERLGVEGRDSRQAERLICLAVASWSYDIWSARLKEFCGLEVSDTTICEVAQEHGSKSHERWRTEPVAVQEFREADGEIEFTADGTCVDAREGDRQNLIGRRRTAAAARWLTRRVERLAGLCSLAYSHQWDHYESST